MSDFAAKVYQLISRIPRGAVATYGQIALSTGNPLAARAVGAAMRNCPDTLCWYRVVRSDGRLIFEMQKALLEQEGISFLPDGRVDIKKHAIREIL